jgi:hypothetical protein
LLLRLFRPYHEASPDNFAEEGGGRGEGLNTPAPADSLLALRSSSAAGRAGDGLNVLQADSQTSTRPTDTRANRFRLSFEIPLFTFVIGRLRIPFLQPKVNS